MKKKHSKEGARKKPNRTLAVGLILLAFAVLFATLPFMLMVVNQGQSSREVSAHEKAVQALKYPEADVALQKAEEYNQRLFEEGAHVIGEAVDPWGGGDQSASQSDEGYQGVLDTPDDGIMATLLYPRLGIDLPIRHGTSPTVLSAGAGHLYGTSVPVGGMNTHAVLSAHTGYDRLMFDRLSLGEGRKGDIFYISVLGRTLAYQVDNIEVIEPSDFSHFNIEAGKDQVTLLTCTPYGVNTQRLIVTGQRVSIPEPAPDPKDVPRAHPERIFVLGVALAWALFLAFIVLFLRRRKKRKEREAKSVQPTNEAAGSELQREVTPAEHHSTGAEEAHTDRS